MKNSEQYHALMAAVERQTCELPDPRVKAALLEEFRRHRVVPPMRRRVAAWSGIAAAMAASLAAVVLMPRESVTPPPMVVFQNDPPPIGVKPAVTVPPRRIVARRKPTAPKAKVVKESDPPPEIATDFVAIPYAEPLRPDERADVFRVEMPRAGMAVFGLPLPGGRLDSRIKADVVMGEDGVARAIRFVR